MHKIALFQKLNRSLGLSKLLRQHFWFSEKLAEKNIRIKNNLVLKGKHNLMILFFYIFIGLYSYLHKILFCL